VGHPPIGLIRANCVKVSSTTSAQSACSGSAPRQPRGIRRFAPPIFRSANSNGARRQAADTARSRESARGGRRRSCAQFARNAGRKQLAAFADRARHQQIASKSPGPPDGSGVSEATLTQAAYTFPMPGITT